MVLNNLGLERSNGTSMQKVKYLDKQLRAPRGTYVTEKSILGCRTCEQIVLYIAYPKVGMTSNSSETGLLIDKEKLSIFCRTCERIKTCLCVGLRVQYIYT